MTDRDIASWHANVCLKKEKSVYSKLGRGPGIDIRHYARYLRSHFHSRIRFETNDSPKSSNKSGFRREMKKESGAFLAPIYIYIYIDETRETEKITGRVHFPVNAWTCIYDCQLLKGERALKFWGMSNDRAVAAAV